MAFPYLKEAAMRYARAAVIADRDGKYDVAVKNYNKAIEVFSKIIKLYPDSPLTPMYKELVAKYKKRVKELEERKTERIEYSGNGSGDGGKESFWKDIVLEKKPSIRFTDIADLEHAKRAIREAIVYPVRRPDLFPLGWPRGILLFGPPGCGKTMLAAAVANEIDGVFLQVDATNIMSKWLGEAEKNVAKIFKFAREKSSEGIPVIIFIDEIDALLGVFSSEVGGEVRVRNQFLKEMDGLRDKDSKHHVYVIGATNKPWKLDEAFVRRFNKRIYIPLPNKETRIQLFKLYLKNLRIENNIDYEKLADLTEGYSGSDIRDVVIEAHNRVIREFFEKQGGIGDPRPLGMDDLIHAIKSRKPSVDPLTIKRIEAWASQHQAL